mgnify:CR=1 FL=1
MKHVKLFDNFVESKKNKDSLNDDKSIIPKVNYGDKEAHDDEDSIELLKDVAIKKAIKNNGGY